MFTGIEDGNRVAMKGEGATGCVRELVDSDIPPHDSLVGVAGLEAAEELLL